MAAFADESACETRAKAQMVAGTWINAHFCRLADGTLAVRFQRPMSPTNPGYGAWVTATDDATD